MPHLLHSPSARRLIRGAEAFDPWSLAWVPIEGATPPDAAPIAPVAALRVLYGPERAAGGPARRVPVGVIGARDAGAGQRSLAEEMGRRLGEAGAPVLCGGHGGVMEAVCKGCLEAGGEPIGILPDEGWEAANPFVAIPLATGLGSARNAVIARASLALVAIGGGHGTLSEIAFALHFGRPVVALAGAPDVPGTVRCASADEAMETIAASVLRLRPAPGGTGAAENRMS